MQSPHREYDGGEKSSDAPLLSFPFSFAFLRSPLLLPVSTVSLTPLSSWNCSSEMQEILRAREAAAMVRRKRAGKQIPHSQNDRRGESARTRGSTLACAVRTTSLCTYPSFLLSVCRPPYTFQQAPFPGHAQSGRTSLFSGCMIELHWPVALSPQFYHLYSSYIDHFKLHSPS